MARGRNCPRRRARGVITKHCPSNSVCDTEVVCDFTLFFRSCGVDPVEDSRERSSGKKWVERVFLLGVVMVLGCMIDTVVRVRLRTAS